MPIFDALYGETEIKLIPMRHEQGASHAADGYARATGNVGVALATSGPGATNLVTGIATAYMDSIPMVAITGQVFTHYIGSDAFQECDIIGVTRPICKHSYLIKNSDEVADVSVLTELNKQVGIADIDPWRDQIQEWKQKYPFEYEQKADKVMPQYVIEQIYEHFSDAIVVADVGQHQMWAAQYFKFTEPRQWLNSGGLGTMGFSLPAAIGAQLGCPDKTVVNINGDGSYIMTIQELVPAVTMKLPLKIFIINNMYLGMVRQWQELFHGKRYSAVDYHDNPDFALLAQAFGATGLRVEHTEDVVPALQKAKGITDGPVVIDFIVDEEENVFPMVPAGAGLGDVIRGLS
ncbi:Acetolactate synthase large subunit [Geodia barretti]|uniref:2-hydroxyacyl-CoA lyase 2 n=1 Tax=Geodia barretti TaxID=519541 RepID=A0AA35T3L7_GEOBA|nr:Acetolactate synthase large subunit [Geodia barretti]